jgi:hypothetical protein
MSWELRAKSWEQEFSLFSAFCTQLFALSS